MIVVLDGELVEWDYLTLSQKAKVLVSEMKRRSKPDVVEIYKEFLNDKSNPLSLDTLATTVKEMRNHHEFKKKQYRIV